MRQLNIRHRPDLTAAAERAEALARLQHLAATRPLGLPAADEAGFLRYLVSLAVQYRGRGVTLVELVEAGYEGAAAYKDDRFRAWWARQKMVKIMADR